MVADADVVIGADPPQDLQIIFANATRNNTVRIDAPSSFITLDRTNYQ